MCCISMRTLSQILGWLHLIGAAAASIGLLALMCAYSNRTNDDTVEEELILGYGLHTILLMFLVSVADIIFSLLLLRGISEERHKLMAPFVYANYVALGFLVLIIIIYFISDLIEATFGDLMIDLILNTGKFGVTLLFFWPIHVIYHQMRNYPDRPDQHYYKDTEPAAKSTSVQTDDV